MLREDYVSFETAKLLKEKGFEECVRHYYFTEITHVGFKDYPIGVLYTDSEPQFQNNYKNKVAAPNLHKVMKWLREIHQIYISVECCYDKSVYYTFDIFRIKDGQYEFIGCSGPDEDTDDWSVDYSYEKAENRAIDYCLIHLI